VLIVAAAGNEAGELGAIAHATHQFDNVLAVGAAIGTERAESSNFGEGLDLVADVQQVSNGLAGTSAAAALVTGAVSQVWATNPLLSYQQVVDVLKRSAIDIAEVGFDPFTGAGLIDLGAAISLAKITLPDAGAIALGELAQTGYVVGDGVSQERPANPANLPFYNGVRGGLLRREARSLKLLV
jgi:subtilisin family serine protease